MRDFTTSTMVSRAESGVFAFDEVEVRIGTAAWRGDGRLAAVNAVGVCDDEARLGLAEDLPESHAGNGARRDDIAEKGAGPHARQLVDVAHEHHARAIANRLQESVGHGQIDHRGFVDDEDIGLQRRARVSLEGAALGLELQEAVQRRGVAARRLGEALCRSARRRREPHDELRVLEDRQNGPHDSRLADARAARKDQKPLLGGALDGFALLFGELHL